MCWNVSPVEISLIEERTEVDPLAINSTQDVGLCLGQILS